MPDLGPPSLLITTSVVEGGVTVAVSGEIDIATHEQFTDAVLAAAGDGLVSAVMVDLSAVTFFDSSAVSALLLARLLVRERGSKFILGDISDMVRRTLEIVGLYDHVRSDG